MSVSTHVLTLYKWGYIREGSENDPVLLAMRQSGSIRRRLSKRRSQTHGQPLGVILLVGGKQRSGGVVGRKNEAGKVGQELAAEVEDDEEEVEGDDADNGVGLGNTSLPLQVVQGGVLGKLSRSALAHVPIWQTEAPQD